jgi:hypothetical protein
MTKEAASKFLSMVWRRISKIVDTSPLSMGVTFTSYTWRCLPTHHEKNDPRYCPKHCIFVFGVNQHDNPITPLPDERRCLHRHNIHSGSTTICLPLLVADYVPLHVVQPYMDSMDDNDRHDTHLSRCPNLQTQVASLDNSIPTPKLGATKA